MTTPVIYPAVTPLNEQQRAAFYAYYPAVQRDELTGVLLALLLGTFGAHHFYLRRPVLGTLYVLFCWTSIPFWLGLIEAFFMPGRVRRFNAEQADLLAMSLMRGYPVPGVRWAVASCAGCGRMQPAGVHYCAGCGCALAT